MTTTERSDTLEAATHDAPLDLDHLPADFPEAVEMLKRAKRELTTLRLRYTWKPMKDAPWDRLLLIKHESLEVELEWASNCANADDWMEIP